MLVSQSQLQGSNWIASYYGYDGHGNVTFLTDGAGAVTDTYDYDAYGSVVASTGSTANEYLYSGQRRDAALGMYHLRARYYDTGRGRFTTVDPLQEKDWRNPIGLNRYLYANANPVSGFDPTGEDATYGALASFGTNAVNAASATFQLAVAKAAYTQALADNPSNPLGTVPGKVATVSLLTAGMGVRGLGITVACEFSLAASGFVSGLPDGLCTQRRNACLPCAPVPVGGEAYLCHSAADGNDPHAGMDDHTHHFKMHQSPPSAGCRCFWDKDFVEATPGCTPRPGAVPVEPASGGGIAP
jgi:RHS repeat-associated protein